MATDEAILLVEPGKIGGGAVSRKISYGALLVIIPQRTTDNLHHLAIL
jgi:hypothetical protein